MLSSAGSLAKPSFAAARATVVATVNASLRDEWRVYEAATAVFRHQYAASVYGAASQYARTHNVTWMKG